MVVYGLMIGLFIGIWIGGYTAFRSLGYSNREFWYSTLKELRRDRKS